MNSLQLREMNQQHIVYAYLPDGKGEPGEIEYLFSDGKAYVLRKSPDDIGGGYAFKACKKVAECVNENNLPMNFIQAWY